MEGYNIMFVSSVVKQDREHTNSSNGVCVSCTDNCHWHFLRYYFVFFYKWCCFYRTQDWICFTEVVFLWVILKIFRSTFISVFEVSDRQRYSVVVHFSKYIIDFSQDFLQSCFVRLSHQINSGDIQEETFKILMQDDETQGWKSGLIILWHFVTAGSSLFMLLSSWMGYIWYQRCNFRRHHCDQILNGK